MYKLTNPTGRAGEKHPYADTIGASSGTVLLIIAESIPDHYWFRTCVLLAVPSVSIRLPKIANFLIRKATRIIRRIQASYTEKRIERKLLRLRENSYVPVEDVRELESLLASAKIQKVEATIARLKKMKD